MVAPHFPPDPEPLVIDVPARPVPPPPRPTGHFMMGHPARVMALGFGSGLSPIAPGTAGTLWAWMSYVLMAPVLSDLQWAGLSLLAAAAGVWACARTARDLGMLDPSAVVWDEIAAFWLVLWVLGPVGWVQQAMAFALFRLFDASKWGPVGWADGLTHHLDPRADRHAWTKAGAGIMLDDYVAAFCTLVVLALWRQWLHGG